MKKRTNLLALVLSITAITFTLFGCSSDTGQKKSIAAPGSATEAGGGAESSGTGTDQISADETTAVFRFPTPPRSDWRLPVPPG